MNYVDRKIFIKDDITWLCDNIPRITMKTLVENEEENNQSYIILRQLKEDAKMT